MLLGPPVKSQLRGAF
jgi:hypothetical protein